MGRTRVGSPGPLGDPETLIVPSLSVYEVFKRVLEQRDETAALQAAD